MHNGFSLLSAVERKRAPRIIYLVASAPADSCGAWNRAPDYLIMLLSERIDKRHQPAGSAINIQIGFIDGHHSSANLIANKPSVRVRALCVYSECTSSLFFCAWAYWINQHNSAWDSLRIWICTSENNVYGSFMDLSSALVFANPIETLIVFKVSK